MILEQLNSEDKSEIKELSKYALMVAEVFSGYWSVDFAKGLNDKWYLIDMARGEDSFHWLECKYCSKEMREQYKDKAERDKIETKEFEEFKHKNE